MNAEHALLYRFVEREMPYVTAQEFEEFAKRELIVGVTQQWEGDMKVAAWVALRVAKRAVADAIKAKRNRAGAP